jgi:hypothetical protein
MTTITPVEPPGHDELQALIEEARLRARRRRRGIGALTTFTALAGAGVYMLAAGPLDASTRASDRTAGLASIGGCGATQLLRGAVPAWTAPAFSDSSPGPPMWPHAISRRGTVVAIVFGYPLRAGQPTNPANKVLWIMRLPRNGSPLTITARPLHANAPRVTGVWPADSSPGEIYPSYVNVPSAGCWRITLRWAGHTDSIDLPYRPRSPA